jgi:hypothetical protein
MESIFDVIIVGYGPVGQMMVVLLESVMNFTGNEPFQGQNDEA